MIEWSMRWAHHFSALVLVLALAMPACDAGGFNAGDVDLEPQEAPGDAADAAAAADLAAGDDARFDGSVADGADQLRAVSHPRELRAMWLASVFRLDFPSTTNLTEAQARAELSAIVDVTAAAGLNALFFQVRPESDTLYSSTLEPWSRFLTGTQGTVPLYDPLALLIELGHAKGIEVHAWLNPYRGLITAGSQTSANHVTKLFAEAAITYNGAVTMDPADSRVRAHVIAVVTDLTRRFDIDGVVFDDYFYPYPAAGAPYPDDTSYQAYLDGGGTMTRSDWRRDNVNQLVSGVASAIRAEKSWVRWGVAPFGIYRPGMPPGVTGLDAYEALSCDSVHWINQGWVDYLAPQLYWTSVSTGQPFGPLIDWWAGKSKPNRPIFASLGLYKLGSTAEWTRTELETQVALTRAEAPGALGQTWFRYSYLESDVQGVSNSFKQFYASPARPPVIPQLAGASLAPPTVVQAGASVTLSHALTVRGFAVYRFVASDWKLVQWVPSGTPPIVLSSGSYAISAIDRGGVESLGVALTVP